MEIERVTEFPMHQRPRKRPRLGWDVAPQQLEAQLGLFCGQEVGNLTSYAPSRTLSDHPSSLFLKDLARNVSPPLRADDEDGHYMFERGENLTSRCNYLLPSSDHIKLLLAPSSMYHACNLLLQFVRNNMKW